MNNDDVKKFINISNLYTEVLDVNQKKQDKVDENWFTDAIKGIFGGSDKETEKATKEIIDAAPDNVTDDFNDLITEPEEPKAAPGQDNNPDTDGGQATDAARANDQAQNDRIDRIAQQSDDAADAARQAKNATDDDEVMSQPVEPANQQGVDGSADAAAQDNNPNTDGGQAADPDATDPRGDQTNPPANTQGGEPTSRLDTKGETPGAEPATQGEPTSRLDTKGETPAATPASNGSLLGRKLDTTTPNLMKAYNDGGKKSMPSIKNMQTALSRLGFDPNGLDGKYGNGTFKAVQEFQKANGLSVDGQAGPSTMAAIKKALDDNFEKNKVTPQDAPKAADEPQGEPTSRLDTKGETPQGGGADANSDPMTAANQQKDIDTAQPNADVARYIELLNKLEGTGSTYDEIKPQTVSASYDFGKLIQLVESKLLNEKLTPAEMDELKALHGKVQGHVGIPGMDDNKITTALNRYLKLVKEPADKADAQNKASDAQLIAKGQAAKADAQNKASDAQLIAKAPKVSKELFIQSPTSAGDFNVPQMKKKYPSPYIVIPQKDGTVIHGFGKPENLEAYQKNKKGSKIVDKSTAQAAPPKTQGADRGPASDQQAGEPDAGLDARERGLQTASKDNNMKKAIKEASMNISINGDSAAEVAELAGILKNAGMNTGVQSIPGGAALDMDKDGQNDMEIMPHNHMDGHDDMVSTMRLMEPPSSDSPCGMGEEGVEEDWDNSPDESYADTQTMTKDLSGGLNREKKAYAAAQDGDNAMAVETSIKEQLWAALNEKMTAEGRGRGKTLKASRGEKLNASRGSKLMASRGKNKKTSEGSRGKKSRGKKSRG